MICFKFSQKVEKSELKHWKLRKKDIVVKKKSYDNLTSVGQLSDEWPDDCWTTA